MTTATKHTNSSPAVSAADAASARTRRAEQIERKMTAAQEALTDFDAFRGWLQGDGAYAAGNRWVVDQAGELLARYLQDTCQWAYEVGTPQNGGITGEYRTIGAPAWVAFPPEITAWAKLANAIASKPERPLREIALAAFDTTMAGTAGGQPR